MDARPAEHETSREAKLFAIIGKKDFEIEELQNQNAALRAQLQSPTRPPAAARGLAENDTQLASGAAGQLVAHAGRKVHARPAEADYEALNRMYEELDWRYKSLEALHRRCEGKIIALDAKCKAYKSKAWQWKTYVDRQEAEGRIPRPSTSSSGKADRRAGVVTSAEAPSADADRTPRPNLKAAEGTQRREQPAPVSPARQSSPPHMQGYIRQEQPQVSQPLIGSSQTTDSVDEEAQLRPSNARMEIPDSSDEEPELISERCLKRRAPRSSARESPPRRIKREFSSPHTNIAVPSGDPPQTCLCHDDESCRCDELDNIRPGGQQSNRTRGSGRRASSEEHVGRMLHRSTSSLSEGDPRARMSAPLPASMKVNEQIGGMLPVASSPCSSLRGNKDVLRPLSANAPLLPRPRMTPISAPNGARKSTRSKVGVLSEDGDDSSQVMPTPKDVEIPQPCKDATLDGLLTGHSSDLTPDVPRHLRVSVHKSQMRTSAKSRTPSSHPEARSPNKRPVVPSMSRGVEPPPPPPHRPEEGPLRLRDVRTMKLDDFRINPDYLGSEFAFADTLRGRDQRRVLHVCTRSDCCGGAMQSVIAMGGQKVSGKTDAQALDDYLGPQYKQIMGNYDAAKRKEAVLQAHVHAFTKQHGKHRQAFERQSTPANFWRTDFPTTQENLEDRQKSHEKDRQDIEIRYHEAMRHGGRWRFRDE